MGKTFIEKSFYGAAKNCSSVLIFNIQQNESTSDH
jgi:hypothetical protein